jgi:hypothetical protein
MNAQSLLELQSFEQLLSNQIEANDSPSLRKKLAAVRVQIEDAEAALTRQQILETIT